MIVAEQKPLDEIMKMTADADKVLVLGCGTCVTVCFAGGEKEAEILASSHANEGPVGRARPRRSPTSPCSASASGSTWTPAAEAIRGADTVVSLACGIGAQAIVERFPEAHMVPGLNTRFYGLPTTHGVWEERCAGCGDCVLEYTDGICPVARCSKGLLNGPCGGTKDGNCEVSSDIPCAWFQIVERMEKLGHLDRLGRGPRTQELAGGPRRRPGPDRAGGPGAGEGSGGRGAGDEAADRA